VKGKESWIWKLKKCVYGLKQASLMWKSTFHQFVTESLGMKEVYIETCVYIKKDHKDLLFIMVYVDDFIIASTNDQWFTQVEQQLINKFRVKPLGIVSRYLGMNFEFKKGGVFMHQKDVIEKLCNDYNLNSGRDVFVPIPEGIQCDDEMGERYDSTKYRKAIGLLNWIAICTRPDIACAVSMLARFSENPSVLHWERVKKIIVYLRTTAHLGILLGRDRSKMDIEAFCDASHGDPAINRMSTTGYIFMLGGAPVLWRSKRQVNHALSSCEAEYVALSEMAQEAKGILNVTRDLWPQTKTIKVYTDSEPARRLAFNSATVRKVKHLELNYHFIRTMVENKMIELVWITKLDNAADILTKLATQRKPFERLREILLMSG
jgi:hypothetical protein